MNPQANEWKPSVSAAAWTPGSGFTVPAPAPAPAPAPPPPPSKQESQASDIDESDPLWQAVLKVAAGDREKALHMLNDPDQLTKYPEVEAVLSGSNPEAIAEDWEKKVEVLEQTDEELAQAVKEQIKIGEEKQDSKPAAKDEADEPAPADQQQEQDYGDDVDEGETDAKKVTKAMTDGDPREHLNLVFIGHVDAGKSTLSGNILYLTENVDKRTIERYEREAKALNRDSWFLAFIMDTNEEERAKGKTVEVGKAFFHTEKKRYTILDAPGHKNYVPNMIQGACQADVGLLVISARKGEFETGFDRGGQTREHAMLAKTLGVSYLIVVVNKMDEPTVLWDKERFDHCVSKIKPFLKSCGFTIKKEVKFIPLSGLGGANVKDEVDPKVCPWWKEYYGKGENNTDKPTLLQLLDSLELKDRNPNLPLRIPIMDRYADRGTIAMGKVESGVVRPGMKIIVMPTRNKFKVEEVWANEDPVSGARPGENVLVKLGGARVDDLRRGYVLCTEPPCRAVNRAIGQIAVADMPDHTRIMTAGFQCILHAHAAEEECTVVKIFETTNAKGQVVKDARFVSIGMRAIVMLEFTQTVPLEVYDNMPFLGRFTLRTEGKTVAIGKVTKLPPKKE